MVTEIILLGLVIGEAGIIYGLLNRLLGLSKIPPLQPLKRDHSMSAEEEEERRMEQRRKLMTLDIPS